MSGARGGGPRRAARPHVRRCGAPSPEPRTARELSGMTSLSEKDVLSHLEHLERSLEAEEASFRAAGALLSMRVRVSLARALPASGALPGM